MNTTMQDDNNRGGRLLMGLLAGTAIGAGLAIYFWPRLALELRQRVATADFQTAASARLDDMATRVADAVNHVAEVADEVTSRTQAARDELADAVGRGAHQVGRGARKVARNAREVEQFAVASKTNHASVRP